MNNLKTENLINYTDYDDKKNFIIIKFDDIFDRKNISHHNKYEIKLRKFYNMLPLISNDVNIILNNYIEYSIKLLNFKIRTRKYFNEKFYLNEAENLSEDELKELDKTFIKNISEIYKDPKLIEIIDEYIESTYTISLDSIITKKINIDLQVTDKVNKSILKSAMMIRVITPIICDYLDNAVSYNKRSIFFKINTDIIKIFSDGKENVLNKLEKIVSSRIYQTRYSDTVIWNYYKLLSIDINSLILEIYNNIIDSIICKIMPNQSSIKYLDVVIRKKISYKFQINFPISYKSLKRGQDDDEIDDKDKMEIIMFNSEIDEGNQLINLNTIKQICKKYNFQESEIKNFEINILKNKNLNEIQNYFVQLYFGNKFNYTYCNYSQKVILLMGLIKELTEKGFNYIIKLLQSTINRDTFYISKRKISNKVLNSNEFKKLNEKYLPVLDIFIKDNPVAKILSFKNYKFDNKLDISDTDSYTMEVIKFLNMI